MASFVRASRSRAAAAMLFVWAAAALAAQRADVPPDPAALLARAEQLRSAGTADSYKTAIPLFEQAAAAFERAHEAIGRADALTGLGRCQDALGDKRRALDQFDQARAIYRVEGKAGPEAQVLNYAALAFNALGERDKAQAALDAALGLARQAGDVRTEGLTFNNMGLVSADRGDQRKALALYNDALPLHRKAGNVRGESTTLANIGTTYDHLGEKTQAIEYLTQALALRRQLKDPADLASTLNNLGAVYFSTDDFDRAHALYSEALPNWQQAGNRAGEAATLHNIANIYEFTGEYQTALDYYRRAIPLQQAVRYREGEANTLTNMARLYYSLGDREQAIDTYTRALDLHRAVENRRGQAIALTSLGAVYLKAGDRAQALDLFTQALSLGRAIGDRSAQAAILNHLGQVAAADGQPDQASEYHRQALELYQAIGSRRGEGSTRVFIGTSKGDSGDMAAARESFDRALVLMRQVGDRSGEAHALHLFASAERAHGSLEAARDRIDTALSVIESLRTNVGRPDLRSSFFATVQDFYGLAIDVLMQLDRAQPGRGHAAAALQASERARARSLLDLLGEAGAEIRSAADPDLFRRATELERTINVRAERLARIVAGRSEEQARQLAREIESLTTEYNDVDARIRQASPRYAAITQRQPATIDRIQALIDRDTRLLEFALGAERSYLWVVSPDRVTAHELPPRASIESAARDLVKLVSTDRPSGDVGKAAARLSGMIIAPAAAELSARRLVIVADGALQYVPFAALLSTGASHPLVFEHEIVSLPSASTLAVLREQIAGRKPAPRALAILADPVFRFDDPRVERAAAMPQGSSGSSARAADPFSPFPRLIGSRREADRIASLLPSAQRREALDFDASRATLASPSMAEYRIVHLATHGVLDASHPSLSGVVLSLVDARGQPQNGFLRLHDIYNLKLGSDLVVLSACQTALGQDIRGEGLVGLARGFMYSGVPGVVASLWKVDDRATAELMVRFYRGMLGPSHLRPAAALRAAQTWLAAQPGWQSPYYWAGFVLQGEWK